MFVIKVLDGWEPSIKNFASVYNTKKFRIVKLNVFQSWQEIMLKKYEYSWVLSKKNVWDVQKKKKCNTSLRCIVFASHTNAVGI